MWQLCFSIRESCWHNLLFVWASLCWMEKELQTVDILCESPTHALIWFRKHLGKLLGPYSVKLSYIHELAKCQTGLSLNKFCHLSQRLTYRNANIECDTRLTVLLAQLLTRPMKPNRFCHLGIFQIVVPPLLPARHSATCWQRPYFVTFSFGKT